MNLAEHLGALQPGPSADCGVCRWYDQLDPVDRAAFDDWLDRGGSVSELWRKCATWPNNPLHLKRPRFSEHVNHHREGGTRVVAV
ncbi:hypothetical protein PBI_OKIROE_33 [Mycobacterium phage OkiRoe]|uniref:Uncharacterized protein n=1 Tax=Mycobacterium phage Gengar TaxID=1891963 RepID=A0A1C9EGR5_9CAUD|nr:hypothetical protein PBI_OKIROE_33 [Mycobacterium phage OkiRoe]YP_009282278.1 hypothetical protein SEA_GENGAR_33 [Mycobacterium phage Gengar]AHZ95594.1 hypothetical protein PBI_OKIROE_33 [Mycobacterium phage OkiRoe]AON96688.1 hypothetical protein SEA_GENGAR_33 [Mycobacterium phage Gengar]